MFEKFLQDLGLSDKEARVYLHLLTVDNDSVIDIANKTGVNRTTVYPILEELAKKGLVSEVKIDKKVRYQAESPERLETFVQRRKLMFDEQEKKLKDVLPQIKAITRESGQRPIVKIYEGRDGIISSLEEFYTNVNDGEVSYSVYSKDLLSEIFSEKETTKFFNLRKNKKQMFSKAIYTKTGDDITSDEMSERVRFDKDKYPIDSDVTISGDVVVFSSLKNNLTSIYIKSKDVADTIKSLVNYITDSKK